jgi:hypothetical protein
MFTLPVRTLLAAAVAALVSITPASAQNSPAAQRVLDRARMASGGAGWNKLMGLHETGRVGGLRYERWLDPVRYGLRKETMTPAGKFVEAYNGAGEWRILSTGQKTGSMERPILAEVRSDAFFGVYGYFYPSRFDLRSSYLGLRQGLGRSCDVLRVQPAGGEPRELWFDHATGLLALVVDETGPRQGRTEVSDYRRVGPIKIPFRSVTTGGDRTQSEERRLDAIDFPVADRNLFSLPPPRP